MRKSLPNFITNLRIFLALIFLIICSLPNPIIHKFFWGNIIFIIASGSDFLDGFLARKLKVVSDYGKLVDPLADKILLLSCFVILCQKGVVGSFLTTLVVLRELLVGYVRLYGIKNQIVLQADKLGKIKTVLLIIVGVFLLEKVSQAETGFGILSFFKFLNQIHLNLIFSLIYYLLIATVALNYISLANYFRKVLR